MPPISETEFRKLAEQQGARVEHLSPEALVLIGTKLRIDPKTTTISGVRFLGGAYEDTLYTETNESLVKQLLTLKPHSRRKEILTTPMGFSGLAISALTKDIEKEGLMALMGPYSIFRINYLNLNTEITLQGHLDDLCHDVVNFLSLPEEIIQAAQNKNRRVLIVTLEASPGYKDMHPLSAKFLKRRRALPSALELTSALPNPKSKQSPYRQATDIFILSLPN